jgi:hypothetical protein
LYIMYRIFKMQSIKNIFAIQDIVFKLWNSISLKMHFRQC